MIAWRPRHSMPWALVRNACLLAPGIFSHPPLLYRGLQAKLGLQPRAGGKRGAASGPRGRPPKKQRVSRPGLSSSRRLGVQPPLVCPFIRLPAQPMLSPALHPQASGGGRGVRFAGGAGSAAGSVNDFAALASGPYIYCDLEPESDGDVPDDFHPSGWLGKAGSKRCHQPLPQNVCLAAAPAAGALKQLPVQMPCPCDCTWLALLTALHAAAVQMRRRRRRGAPAGRGAWPGCARGGARRRSGCEQVGRVLCAGQLCHSITGQGSGCADEGCRSIGGSGSIVSD